MSMQAALERAGVNVAASRLRSLAYNALIKHHRNVERAFKTFEADIGSDPALLRELKLAFLQRQADEMPSARQSGSASLTGHAGARQTNGDVDGRENAGIQVPHANPSPVPAGAGHDSPVAQSRPVRPGREPSAADRAAASSIAKVLAITVLDTFRVRDGRAIGDVRYGELDRMRGANLLEASVIKQIKEHGVAPHDARVRDIVKADALQRMIQRAAEVSDAS